MTSNSSRESHGKASEKGSELEEAVQYKMAVKQASIILFCLLMFSPKALSDYLVGKPVFYKDCVGEKTVGELKSVDITPCPTQPCVFHKGTEVHATITFTVKEVVTNGTLDILGSFHGMQIPFPLDQPRACHNHGLICPLKPGLLYNLDLSFYIKKIYPSLQVVAQFEFKDQVGNSVFCFAIAVRISD